MLTKVVVALAAALIVLIATGWLYFQSAFPAAGPAPDIAVEPTPERLERGRYLANHVAVCIDCHSTRDWNYYAGPVIAGTEGHGGERFGEEMGFPGTFYSQNITPAGLGDWTDGEILRAITSGVKKDGSAFFPVMPYTAYNRMAREDVYAIIAYLRSLEPGGSTDWPATQLNFPLNIIVKTIPEPYEAPAAPDPADELVYGEYLATISGCAECHTPMVKGKKIEGMDFAGGFEFQMPSGVLVRSANITPDPKTGIGGWELETFMQKFRSFAGEGARTGAVGEKENNTVMPWLMYAGMTERDLKAIYTYLRTVKPVGAQSGDHASSSVATFAGTSTDRKPSHGGRRTPDDRRRTAPPHAVSALSFR